MPEKIKELIPFKQTLTIAGTATSGAKVSEHPSFNGIIRGVEIHWPDGCNAVVDVAVYHNTERFCPREGYLSLNDVTRNYPFDRPIKQTDNIMVEMRNGDGAWPHTISVNVMVEET